MKVNYILIKPDRLNVPLAPCAAGQLSSAVWIVYGDIPDDVEGVSVQIERTPDPDTQEQRENFTAATTEEASTPARAFRCYLAPWYFPDASDALKYHVFGVDANGNPRWLGSGALRVLENPSNGSAVTPEIIPADTYIRNPVTGLYHKITAEVNELGEITTVVDPKGIQR